MKGFMDVCFIKHRRGHLSRSVLGLIRIKFSKAEVSSNVHYFVSGLVLGVALVANVNVPVFDF